jgi:hypothetical protein
MMSGLLFLSLAVAGLALLGALASRFGVDSRPTLHEEDSAPLFG